MINFKQIEVYYGNRSILSGVSVSFFKGLNYIVGSNGSGKTTLIRSLLGLVPFSGAITLSEKNISSLNPTQLAKKVAVVHQQLNLPFKVNVFDFVLMGRFPYLKWLGNYSQHDMQIAQQQLDLLNIENLTDRHLDEISGGELQKVYIARALAQESDILVLDEPAQALDPMNKQALYSLLEQLADNGKIILCITHDLFPLKNPNARVVGLNAGKIVWDRAGGAGNEELMETVYHQINN